MFSSRKCMVCGRYPMSTITFTSWNHTNLWIPSEFSSAQISCSELIENEKVLDPIPHKHRPPFANKSSIKPESWWLTISIPNPQYTPPNNSYIAQIDTENFSGLHSWSNTLEFGSVLLTESRCQSIWNIRLMWVRDKNGLLSKEIRIKVVKYDLKTVQTERARSYSQSCSFHRFIHAHMCSHSSAFSHILWHDHIKTLSSHFWSSSRTNGIHYDPNKFNALISHDSWQQLIQLLWSMTTQFTQLL